MFLLCKKQIKTVPISSVWSTDKIESGGKITINSVNWHEEIELTRNELDECFKKYSSNLHVRLDFETEKMLLDKSSLIGCTQSEYIRNLIRQS